MRRTTAIALLVAVPACVTSPQSQTSIESSVHEVEFSGLAVYRPGLRVQVQARASSGSFTTLATANVNRQGRWTVTVPVPDSYFGGLCGKATLRAVTNPGGQVLPAADAPCASHLPPNPTLAELESCAVQEISIDRGGPVAYVGNLDLNGAADAEPYQCLTSVEGNLTIHGGRTLVTAGFYQPGLSFTLPKLATVTGNLSIDGDRAEHVSLPLLSHVAGSVALSMTRFGTLVPPATSADAPVFAFPATAIDLPLLASVGGDIELRNKRESASGGSSAFHYDFGLNALTALGGSVSVINHVFPATIDGLTALTTVHGNVLVDWGVSDLFTTPLLTGVTHVEGNFELIGPPNARGVMSALTTVDGNVTVHSASATGSTRLDPALLSGLAHVGGDLVLDRAGTESSCSVLLGALTDLGGALRMTNCDASVRFGATGGSHLTLGALHVSTSNIASIPLSADAVVAATGAIDIANNPSLCPCVVDGFVALQTAIGWLGAATNAGNGSSASCNTCPASFCP